MLMETVKRVEWLRVKELKRRRAMRCGMYRVMGSLNEHTRRAVLKREKGVYSCTPCFLIAVKIVDGVEYVHRICASVLVDPELSGALSPSGITSSVCNSLFKYKFSA